MYISKTLIILSLQISAHKDEFALYARCRDGRYFPLPGYGIEAGVAICSNLANEFLDGSILSLCYRTLQSLRCSGISLFAVVL